MSADADLLILGGGIAGLTTALAAADRQLSVILIDSPRPGAASRAAAGMLAPSAEKVPQELRDAALAARDFYPAFLDALRDRTGIAVPLDRRGILELAPEGEAERLRASIPEGSRWLDEGELRELEPALEGHPGALLHPIDGAVDNVVLMDALERAVERVPTIKRVAAEILGRLSGGGRQSGRRGKHRDQDGNRPPRNHARAHWCATSSLARGLVPVKS